MHNLYEISGNKGFDCMIDCPGFLLYYDVARLGDSAASMVSGRKSLYHLETSLPWFLRVLCVVLLSSAGTC